MDKAMQNVNGVNFCAHARPRTASTAPAQCCSDFRVSTRLTDATDGYLLATQFSAEPQERLFLFMLHTPVLVIPGYIWLFLNVCCTHYRCNVRVTW